MAGTFVPFFEKQTGGETLPEYQFTQYQPERIEPPPPAPPDPSLKTSVSEVGPKPGHPALQKIQRIDRNELKTKLQSDLRNAIALGLPEATINRIQGELAKFRPAPSHSHETAHTESEHPIPADPDSPADKTNITLEKDGDKVTNIIVECDCGQVIELDCVY